MEVYNKNRDNNNSMHDEIREQNAKLKNASLKEKWEYFKEYYLKMTLLILAGVILLISLAYSISTVAVMILLQHLMKSLPSIWESTPRRLSVILTRQCILPLTFQTMIRI
jgi:hypothetical protein